MLPEAMPEMMHLGEGWKWGHRAVFSAVTEMQTKVTSVYGAFMVYGKVDTVVLCRDCH